MATFARNEGEDTAARKTTRHGGSGDKIEAILGVSGGADSVYLLDFCRKRSGRMVVGHFNHRARGRASEADQRFVEELCRDWRFSLEIGKAALGDPGSVPATGTKGRQSRFEEKARAARYAFLKELRERHRAAYILVAHTADDQVETILMRVFEGAGIAGLKGIPRLTKDSVIRPILEIWREDIIESLRKKKIPYRVDKSNFDTRYERNWIRHVLLPLLELRYGKAVKKRIFALGERFREIDEFLDRASRRWIGRNVTREEHAGGESFRLPRKPFSGLPAAVRKKIVQILCFDRMRIAPNERLLESLDRLISEGRPSAALDIGKGATLRCRYGEAVFRCPRIGEGAVPDACTGAVAVVEARGGFSPSRLRLLAEGEGAAVFDADAIRGPFAVRPLRAGDRIRPFGGAGERKAKDILIDRKVPREERWGRPVVCDASGEIVWIPGVVRSSIAPVTRDTRRTVVLRIRRPSRA